MTAIRTPRCIQAALAAYVLLSLAPFVSACAGTSNATEPETSEELAQRLIEMTASTDMADQMMQMMSRQMRPAFPTVPDELWDELLSAMDSTELARLMTPIYTRHYTRDDLAGLVEFYSTPLGQTVIEQTPSIMQESMTVGAQWGQAKANEIVQRLRQKGHQPRQI